MKGPFDVERYVEANAPDCICGEMYQEYDIFEEVGREDREYC